MMRYLTTLCLAGGLAAAGCGGSSDDAPAPATTASPGGDAATPSPAAEPAGEEGLLSTTTVEAHGVEMTLPRGWTVEPVQQSSFVQRAAQFRLGAEELGFASVAVFGAIGGDLETNLGRWESQVVDPVDGPTRRTFEAGGLTVTELFVTGTLQPTPMMGRGPSSPQPGTTMLAAVVQGGPEGQLFIKTTGPEGLLAAQRAHWDALLGSVRAAD